jgi:hypothetical protein
MQQSILEQEMNQEFVTSVCRRTAGSPVVIEPLEARSLMSATLSVSNVDILPGAERMIFNRIQTPNPDIPNHVKDRGTLKLTNTGDQTLRFSSIKVTGPFKILGIAPKSIAPGASVNLTIQFIATTAPKFVSNETSGFDNQIRGGSWIGSMVLNTNDPATPTWTEGLAGWWQLQSEKNEEPGALTLINKLADYKTNIAPAGTVELTEPDDAPKYYGEEVISAYWQVADSSKLPALRQLATFHTQGNDVFANWYAKSNGATHNLFVADGVSGQSFLPFKKGQPGVAAAGNFSPGSGAFGFKIDNEFSDDKLNTKHPTGGGHHIRFYPVRDHLGNILPNAYFLIMDYSTVAAGTTQNYDFQDNVFIVTNVKPAGN